MERSKKGLLAAIYTLQFGYGLTVTMIAPLAALILAGLCAEGETLVDDSGGHIDRGYCRIEEKLAAVGGLVRKIPAP